MNKNIKRSIQIFKDFCKNRKFKKIVVNEVLKNAIETYKYIVALDAQNNEKICKENIWNDAIVANIEELFISCKDGNAPRPLIYHCDVRKIFTQNWLEIFDILYAERENNALELNIPIGNVENYFTKLAFEVVLRKLNDLKWI